MGKLDIQQIERIDNIYQKIKAVIDSDEATQLEISVIMTYLVKGLNKDTLNWLASEIYKEQIKRDRKLVEKTLNNEVII